MLGQKNPPLSFFSCDENKRRLNDERKYTFSMCTMMKNIFCERKQTEKEERKKALVFIFNVNRFVQNQSEFDYERKHLTLHFSLIK